MAKPQKAKVSKEKFVSVEIKTESGETVKGVFVRGVLEVGEKAVVIYYNTKTKTEESLLGDIVAIL